MGIGEARSISWLDFQIAGFKEWWSSGHPDANMAKFVTVVGSMLIAPEFTVLKLAGRFGAEAVQIAMVAGAFARLESVGVRFAQGYVYLPTVMKYVEMARRNPGILEHRIVLGKTEHSLTDGNHRALAAAIVLGEKAFAGLIAQAKQFARSPASGHLDLLPKYTLEIRDDAKNVYRVLRSQYK